MSIRLSLHLNRITKVKRKIFWCKISAVLDGSKWRSDYSLHTFGSILGSAFTWCPFWTVGVITNSNIFTEDMTCTYLWLLCCKYAPYSEVKSCHIFPLFSIHVSVNIIKKVRYASLCKCYFTAPMQIHIPLKEMQNLFKNLF